MEEAWEGDGDGDGGKGKVASLIREVSGFSRGYQSANIHGTGGRAIPRRGGGGGEVAGIVVGILRLWEGARPIASPLVERYVCQIVIRQLPHEDIVFAHLRRSFSTLGNGRGECLGSQQAGKHLWRGR